MSEAREAILGRIRHALADVVDASSEPVAPRRFRTRSDADRETLVADFVDRASRYKVRVERVARSQARATAARILAERGHSHLVVPVDFPEDLTPEGFDLLRDDDLEPGVIAAREAVLTTCACAIAQTGTIVLDHGPGQGRRVLTLLPDYYLCFVDADAILGLVPEAVARMTPSVSAGRPLTFISGPSATSDIELNRVEGVHGPRTLDVIVLEDA